MKKRLLSFIFALSVCVYLITGLASGFAGEHATDENANYGGTLIVGIPGGIDTFNPLFSESAFSQEITHLMLLGLADLNENSEFAPELAESWESSADYLTLTYHLRKDAVWADGVPITAQDVTFTWDVLMDTTVASPRQGAAEYVKRVVAEDKYTVRFEFTLAYPDQMFDTAGEILPKHILQNVDRKTLRGGGFGRNPLSSGPFVLKKWVSQQYIELAPNPRYFGGRPFLDRVIFKIVPDNTNLLLQLQTGEVDMMIGVPPAEVSGLRQTNPDLTIYPVAGRVYYYIGYNNTNPLFADKRVRQALTMAIDRQGIIDAFLYGFGKPCRGPLPPMLKWLHTEQAEKFPFNSARAKEVLKQQGWFDHDGDGWLDKDGKNFAFTIKTNAGNQLRSDIAIIVQDQLRRIGIKVEIATVEWSSLMDALRAQDFDAYMGGWSTSFNVDPTPIFHSASTELFNFVSYANPEVDKLIETGREDLHRETAAGIWRRTQELIYDDQPYTFLFWKVRVVAVNKKFKNVTPLPLSALYDLQKWHLQSN